MARRAGSIALALVGSFVSLFLIVSPVGASSSTRVTDDGWWWRVQTGLGGEQLPPPPNVGDEQLLVQAGSVAPGEDGATAIAAVSAELEDGEGSPQLTLTVADDQGGATAVVLACQAGAAWTGVHAGNWEAKPVADCDSRVAGERADDGSTWTFDLTSLQFADKINVVLVPGADENGAVVPFSLVFEPPDASSIATTSADAAPSTTSTSAAPAVPDTGGSFAPPPPGPGPAAPAPGGAIDVPAAAPPPPALDEADQGLTQTAPIISEASRPVLPEVVDEGSRAAARAGGVLVLLLALGGAALLWRGGDALVRPAPSPDAPVEGGLGRFRRERPADPAPVT